MKALRVIGLPLAVLSFFLLAGLGWRTLGLPSQEELIIIAKGYFGLYGYWIVFGSAIVEGMLLAGFYYPGSLVIFLGVLFAGQSVPGVAKVVLAATAGMLIAYSFNYALGRYGWYGLLLKFGLREPIERAHARLLRHGLAAIFWSYWHPNFAAFASTAAGILALPFRTFLIFSALATIFWSAFWATVAYVLGEATLAIMGIRFVIIAVTVWIGYRLIARNPRDATPGPSSFAGGRMLAVLLNLPWTLAGCLAALISLPTSMQFSRTPPAVILRVKNFWWACGYLLHARAMALGNVVMLGPRVEEKDLEHELVHVRQFMHKPFIMPFLYYAERIRRGRKSGKENRYEEEAYRIAGNVYRSRSAGGVVLNDSGEVLVVCQHGNSWSLPKGHIDPGETALEAARREIAEESGVRRLTFVRELGEYERYRIGKDGGEDRSELKRITMFLFRTDEQELRPEDPENPEARWVPSEAVPALLTHPKDKEFFRRIGIIDA